MRDSSLTQLSWFAPEAQHSASGGFGFELHAHCRDAHKAELVECGIVERLGLDFRLVEFEFDADILLRQRLEKFPVGDLAAISALDACAIRHRVFDRVGRSPAGDAIAPLEDIGIRRGVCAKLFFGDLVFIAAEVVACLRLVARLHRFVCRIDLFLELLFRFDFAHRFFLSLVLKLSVPPLIADRWDTKNFIKTLEMSVISMFCAFIR